MKSWPSLILAVILLASVVGGVRLWRRTDGGRAAGQSQQLLVTDLDSVPTGSRRVLVDESSHHPGELNADDPLWSDSVYVEAWEILGRRDSTVTVNLTSANFEASFLVMGPGFDSPREAEEWRCGARLEVQFSEDALYRVIVTSRNPRATGRFTLRASRWGKGCRIDAEYASLPAGNRRIAVGQGMRGALTADDYQSTGGYRVQPWEIQGRRGTSATVDLISYEFDGHLAIVGPGLKSVRSDNSGGGGCNPRLTVRFPQSGVYHIIVSNNLVDAPPLGRFFLRVSDAPLPKQRFHCRFLLDLLEPASLGTLDLGDGVENELTQSDFHIDGRRFHAWEIHARQGETRTIDARSDEFDVALLVMGPNMFLADEDGGGGCNARVSATFAEEGTYRVFVAAEARPVRFASEVGRYRLEVTEQPDPKRPEDCDRRGQGLIPRRHGELPVYDRLIGSGEEARGELTTADYRRTEGRGGTYVQAWGIQARRGTSATIDMVSDDLNAQLELHGPGLASPLADNDGAGGCHARITVSFPDDGLYRIVVGSAGPPTVGTFMLRVTDSPGPKIVGDC